MGLCVKRDDHSPVPFNAHITKSIFYPFFDKEPKEARQNAALKLSASETQAGPYTIDVQIGVLAWFSVGPIYVDESVE